MIRTLVTALILECPNFVCCLIQICLLIIVVIICFIFVFNLCLLFFDKKYWFLINFSEETFCLCTFFQWGWLDEAKLLLRASNLDWLKVGKARCWLTVGQSLLSLQQVRVEGGMFLFLLFLHFLSFSSFSPVPRFHLYYLSSLSQGEDTNWPTKADV